MLKLTPLVTTLLTAFAAALAVLATILPAPYETIAQAVIVALAAVGIVPVQR